MIISDLPKSFLQLASAQALACPLVGMVSYRAGWNQIQPTQPAAITNNPNDPSYNWSFIDAAFQQAGAFKKLISFHIGVNGESNQPAWVQANAVQFVGISNDTSLSVPWDTYYQSALIAFLQAFGTRYSGQNLYKFSGNIASASNDWTFPSAINGNWTNSAPFTVPAYGAQVTVSTTVNSGMSTNQWCFISGFGWFQCTNVPGPGAAQTKLLNPSNGAALGNANSGTVAGGTTIQVSDVGNWQGPVFNYTTAQLVTACNTIVDTIHTSFPNTQYQLQCGRNKNSLDIWPGGPAHSYNAATQIAQHGYGQGRFSVDRDGFNPTVSSAPQALANGESDNYFLLAETLLGATNSSGTTGVIPANSACNGQFTWPCTDPTGQYTAASTNNYQANGGTPYTNPIPVYNNTVAVANTYNVQVLEVYEQDVIGILLQMAGGASAPGSGGGGRYSFPFNRK